MQIWHGLLLGVIQGLTEFLPISSSGHLVLVERWLQLAVADDHVFDVALHTGSLVALLAYFRKDLWLYVRSVLNPRDPSTQLGTGSGQVTPLYELGCLAVGTVPAVIVGLLLGDWMDAHLRSVLWVGIGLLITAAMLLIGERLGRRERPLTLLSAWWIGCLQAFAIIPAVSRSGATIAGAMTLGLPRPQASRFSFLLGIPALVGATILTLWEIHSEAIRITFVGPYIVGIIASAIVSFLVIKWMMQLVKRHSLSIFVWYLVIVGGAIIAAELLFA